VGVTVKNVAAFKDLKRRLTAVTRSDAMVDELGKRVGAALVKQVADEFRESRDPYGKAWAPLKTERPRNVKANARAAKKGKPQRSGKPLIDTGRLRASVTAITSGGDVRVVLPVQYASYHQNGTTGKDKRRGIPRRQILPEADTGGLGDRWTLAINKEAMALLQKHFGGK
jgi:phage gpG-like protein